MDETTQRQTVFALVTVGRVGTHAEHAIYILCRFGSALDKRRAWGGQAEAWGGNGFALIQGSYHQTARGG